MLPLLDGVGARLDERPDLLFRLRAVDEQDLLSHLNTDSLVSTGASADRARIAVIATGGYRAQLPRAPL